MNATLHHLLRNSVKDKLYSSSRSLVSAFCADAIFSDSLMCSTGPWG